MSQFIGGSDLLMADDERLLPQWLQMDVHIRALAADSGFVSPWWPGSGFFGSLDGDVAILDDAQLWHVQPEVTKGKNTRFGVVGVTRDAYGSILGSCTVALFRTSDRLFVDVIVSDPTTGAYLLSTPYYPDAHFVVMYKAGSPDVFGTTPNTLIGI